MSKFTYPRMRIRLRIPAREAPRMQIRMRMTASARRSVNVDTHANTSF